MERFPFSGRLRYYVAGDGPKILLAFHGVGQTGETCFRDFAHLLSGKYKVYAFDLFFAPEHPDWSELEEWDESGKLVLSKGSWDAMLGGFLEEQRIDRFDVAGFSMGGRFALATLETFHRRMDQVYLMAPDGIKDHFLYRLGTGLKLTRTWLRWFMEKPERLIGPGNFLRRVGVVSHGQIRFTEHLLNSPGAGISTFYSWIAFRKLRFDIVTLYKDAIKSHTKVWLFMGLYDQIIRPDDVSSLSELLPESQFICFKCGHTHLVSKTADFLLRLNQS
jgi:pimeloyl-ACP methyl ester carboxylesterase